MVTKHKNKKVIGIGWNVIIFVQKWKFKGEIWNLALFDNIRQEFVMTKLTLKCVNFQYVILKANIIFTNVYISF